MIEVEGVEKEERAFERLPKELRERINSHVFRCNKAFGRGINDFSRFVSVSRAYLESQVLFKLAEEIDRKFYPQWKGLALNAFLQEIGFDNKQFPGIAPEKLRVLNKEYKKTVETFLKESHPWIFWR